MLHLQRDILDTDLQILVSDLIDELHTNIEHDINEVNAYNRLIEFLLDYQKMIAHNNKV